MAHEINLVPDIKNEMIKALKLRNYIFFACIVVAAASVAVTVIFGVIAGGQGLAVNSKRDAINDLSAKLNSYNDLNDFLTIKNQLSGIKTLTENKQVLSRTFNVLSAIIPTGADTITISELNVDLSTGLPTLSFDAQANAGKEPFIDYNVLDSFKKSMEYMHYDYGRYVDKEGNAIPAYCMIEQGTDGATFKENDDYYAYWTINAEGCNPSKNLKADDYKDSVESYENQTVVRIWRTPQYSKWYKSKETENQPYMSLDGQISNVEHFESQCITYTGAQSGSSNNIKWEPEYKCNLIATGDIISAASTDEEGGISINEEAINTGIFTYDDSNGRDTSDELVLRFSATIWINPEVYKFTNYHMMALAPSGYHNVTDSYVQLQSMFSARAADCAEDDTACQSANASTKSSKNNNTKGNN